MLLNIKPIWWYCQRMVCAQIKYCAISCVILYIPAFSLRIAYVKDPSITALVITTIRTYTLIYASYKLPQDHSLYEDVCLFQKSGNLDECGGTAFVTMMLEEVVFHTNVFCLRSHINSVGCSKWSIIFLKDNGLDYCGFATTKICYHKYFLK